MWPFKKKQTWLQSQIIATNTTADTSTANWVIPVATAFGNALGKQMWPQGQNVRYQPIKPKEARVMLVQFGFDANEIEALGIVAQLNPQLTLKEFLESLDEEDSI